MEEKTVGEELVRRHLGYGEAVSEYVTVQGIGRRFLIRKMALGMSDNIPCDESGA